MTRLLPAHTCFPLLLSISALQCPAKSHYEVCADICSSSCQGLMDIVECPSSCTEGCECDNGFVFNGQECVQVSECGCYDRGRTYKVQIDISVETSACRCISYNCNSDRNSLSNINSNIYVDIYKDAFSAMVNIRKADFTCMGCGFPH